MLTRLSPEKVSEAWPMIERAVVASSMALASMSDDRLNNVLVAIQSGTASCFVHESDNQITTVIVTTVIEEPISKTRDLLIYAAHMFRKLKPEMYVEMAKWIGQYAKGQDCAQVILYCSNDRLTEILKGSGANIIFTLIVFPLVNF